MERSAVAGEVDLLTAGDVEAAITAGVAAAASTLVIDLTEVSFLDSAGLAVLARSQMKAGERIPLLIVVTHPAVLTPLRLTGMDKICTIFDTVADALASGPDPVT